MEPSNKRNWIPITVVNSLSAIPLRLLELILEFMQSRDILALSMVFFLHHFGELACIYFIR